MFVVEQQGRIADWITAGLQQAKTTGKEIKADLSSRSSADQDGDKERPVILQRVSGG
jgi:hypothetical protein